ncbi:translational GTPase TypA [Sneathiella marina]|uniref:Large ribosomal subunit assembly factor BipA n=1 Tax=Sneathiella marina TaxID=2950108 RepID=A0ABY4W105_9PROT|nr:translational GTPase TypA [Sneathiella marina]USG60639.1 translational GTPase TypA [Sneathiella marina]
MEIRNVAIIAHVDHGKTTLVDGLLKQSGTFRDNQQVAERAMDSNDLERERGITILAKCTSVEWEGYRLNIVDTPGHADFGGEVERILSMVDGVVVLVDAAEGPMPQTKFVTQKALGLGLKPIVVINKADRPDARADEVLDECFDLLVALDANEDQLDFPVLYASAKEGWAATDLDEPRENLHPLFDLIVKHVEAPKVDEDAPFRMLVTTIEANPYLGRLLTGRVESGVLKTNDPVKGLGREGGKVEDARANKIMAFRGLERETISEARAGDIVSISGLVKTTVADTIGTPEETTPLEAQPIDPPTISMTFAINSSPLAGRDGDKVQSRVIRSRLMKEIEGNVSIRVEDSAEADAYIVSGRGELQLGVLIETMRREGFELSISRPRVLFREDETTGQTLEPQEEVVVDVDDEFSGVVVEKIALRKGTMTDMRPSGGGKTRITFLCPTRGLIGYHGEFLTDTRGTGIMNRLFDSYVPHKGTIPGRRNGVLIANSTGKSVSFALWNLEARGFFFIGSGVDVYEGMILGEHNRPNDLEVNALKAKQLTNIRASGSDEAVRLTTPRKMTLEQAIAYIDDDELVEVTPNFIRLRKLHLDPHERKKASRTKIAS